MGKLDFTKRGYRNTSAFTWLSVSLQAMSNLPVPIWSRGTILWDASNEVYKCTSRKQRYFVIRSARARSAFNYKYTGCPRRNVPDFGRVFLMLKYTDITQNTDVRSWTVTEIMAREKCGLLAGPRNVPVSWDVLSMFVLECGVRWRQCLPFICHV
jgi:hypothetical protein